MDRFEESVQIIRSLISNEFTDFDGIYYQLKKCSRRAKGSQPGGPPIVIGGGGEKERCGLQHYMQTIGIYLSHLLSSLLTRRQSWSATAPMWDETLMRSSVPYRSLSQQTRHQRKVLSRPPDSVRPASTQLFFLCAIHIGLAFSNPWVKQSNP